MKLGFWNRVKLYFKFPFGCKVRTLKGARKIKNMDCTFGSFEGRVKGYSVWKNFQAVNVKKADGRVVQCLAKNLVRMK